MLSSGRRPWEGRGRGKRKREIGDGGGGRRCPLPPSYATDWGRGARILHRGGERVSPLRPIAFFFRFAPVSLFPECTLRCCPLPLSYGASLHPPRFIEDEQQQHRSLSVAIIGWAYPSAPSLSSPLSLSASGKLLLRWSTIFLLLSAFSMKAAHALLVPFLSLLFPACMRRAQSAGPAAFLLRLPSILFRP